MRPSTLLCVLFLRRDAILDAFHSRWSLPVGGLLVLSAALARNYDGDDLLAEPWWLAGPFAASILTSLILWLLFIPWAKVPGRSLWRLYPRFLGIYWLTAPLAWLYAVPYERFLSPVDAVNANAYTLLVVSLWRVLIISQALSLLFTIRLRAALSFTLMFGSLVMLGAALFGPRPVLDVMGGLRLLPEDRARAALTFSTGFFSAVGFVFFAACAGTFRPKAAVSLPELPPPLPSRTPVAAVALVLVSIAMWAPALWIAQPEQRNRRAAESAFQRADYPAMLAELSRHLPADYPPNWRLPGAHLPAYQRVELLSEILPHVSPDAPHWIRTGYTEMARDSVLFHIPFADSRDWVKWTVEHDGHYLDPAHEPALRKVLIWLTRNDNALTEAQQNQLRSHLTPADEPPSPHP